MKPGKMYRMLGSWWLLAGLLLTLTASYLIFTLDQEPYARWTHFQFHTSAGLFLYLGLIANLSVASVRAVADRISRRSMTRDAVMAMDVWSEMPVSGNYTIPEITAWMQRREFSISTGERTIRGVRGQYSFLPGTVLRAGWVLLLVSLLISVHTRRISSHQVHEGDVMTFFDTPVAVSTIQAGLPKDFLQVGDDSPFRLEKFQATLCSSGKTYTITPGFPEKINGNYYRLIDMGYTQWLIIRRNGRTIEKRVDLDILPPGKTHIADHIAAENDFLTVSLEPDRTITKGLLKGRQYNLAGPYYRITVQNGRKKGNSDAFPLRPGDSHRGASLDLSLGKCGLYARLQVVHDPGLAGVYLGALLTLAGLVMMLSRFFWYRREINVVLADSVITIGYSEEFFKKWGIRKFYRWKDELSRVPAN